MPAFLNFRSIGDLNRAAQTWSAALPSDLALIVGVPRSGLLAALLLALHRNLPVADLDSFLEGKVVGTGASVEGAHPRDARPNGTVLVLDDSVATGNQLRRVKARLAAARISGSVKFGAVYVTDASKLLVDHWHEVVALPRVFEWNIMNHGLLESACVDIDGVLCRDPSAEENDDGPVYQRFIETVKPLIVPRREIGWLVTCRLERYRSTTERWLQANGFRYRQLVMMDVPDKASRQAAKRHALFKAAHYRESGARLFIESSYGQAREVARLTGKDVYSVEAREMIRPGLAAMGVHQPRSLLRMVLRGTVPGRRMLELYHRALGRT